MKVIKCNTPNGQFQFKNKTMTRELAIIRIEDMYAPDSEYTDTASIGLTLLVDTVGNKVERTQWRELGHLDLLLLTEANLHYGEEWEAALEVTQAIRQFKVEPEPPSDEVIKALTDQELREEAMETLKKHLSEWDTLSLKANTDGKTNGIDDVLAAMIEFRSPIEIRLKRAEELLEDLYDVQNGPPLEKYRKDWETTIAKIDQYFNETPRNKQEENTPQLVRPENLTSIKEGDWIIITGEKLVQQPVRVAVVKVSEDGTEIIYNKKKNYYFNLGMFLEGSSWVKECWILK